MTEKRFVPIFDGFDKRVVGAMDNGVIISFMEMFDLLNGLNDENDVLKQQLKTKHIVNKQYEELQRLKEENKKLHRVIEENEKMIQSIYEELTKLRLIKKNLRKIKTQWNWIMESVDYD